jgi:hypothetical protein
MSDLSGNEDIPEYRNITNENMYEFMIWANDKRSGSISVDHFNMIIQANISNWIQENNIKWQFALTLVTDTINNQINIDSHFDISSNIGEDSVESDSVESGDNSYAATILRAQNAGDYATIDTDSEEEYVMEDDSDMEDELEEDEGDMEAEMEEDEGDMEAEMEAKMKPNSLEERRKLFAAAAEKRAKR